jgi:arylsulfatase A
MGIDQIEVPKPSNVYGYTGNNGTIKTPNLAKFATEGLLFQTWYSSFHVCSPSRASMMTGRYSIRNGIGIPNSIYAPHAPWNT